MSTDFTTPINYSGPGATSMAIDAIGNFYLVSAESAYEWNVSAYDPVSNLKWQLPLGSKGCLAIAHSGNLIVAHATKHPDRWHETVISIEEYTPTGELQSRRLIPEANEYISFLRIAEDGAIILGANREIYVDSRRRGYTAFYRMDDLETSPISKSVIDAFAVNLNDILSEEGIYSRRSTTDELSILTYYPYYPNWDTFFKATSAGVDSAGATVIAGIFRDNSGPQPMLHHNDYFLAKFDREGNIEWIQTAGKRRIEGNSGDDYVNNIAIDDSGNIYICGIISEGIDHGNDQAFIAKYDQAGNLVWENTFGGEFNETSYDLFIAKDGVITMIAAGDFRHEVNFKSIAGKTPTYEPAILLIKSEDGSLLHGEYLDFAHPNDHIRPSGILGPDPLASGNNFLVGGQYRSTNGEMFQFLQSYPNPLQIFLSTDRIEENVNLGTIASTILTSLDYTSIYLPSGGNNDNERFRISSNNLLTAESVNYEKKDNYSVRIGIAYASGETLEQDFTISVDNINESPSDIHLSDMTIRNGENAGTAISKLSSTDEDFGETHEYMLVNGNGAEDNNFFFVDQDELRIAVSPNSQFKSLFKIRLQSKDSGGLTFEKSFTLTVNDLNEVPTNLSVSASTFNENIAGGSVVATLSSTDPDADDTHAYSLVSGDGDTDNSAFTIDGDQLKIVDSPDFETKSSYSVRLETKDSGDLTFEKSFTLTVNDLNEVPTNLSVSASIFDENITGSSAVATLSTSDPDSGDTHTYTLVSGTGDTDNSAFTIDGDQLKIVDSPDFETKSSYSIRLQTKDSGGLTFEKAFTLTVNDLNEDPTDLSVSVSTFNENLAGGSVVATLSTSDADSGDNHTYALVSGDGSEDNESFEIVGDELKVKESPDFETKDSYSVRIKTTDTGGLTFEKVVTLTVNDLEETNYDFNKDGKITIQEDALIGLRMMFGTFPGDALTDGALTESTSTDASEVQSLLSGYMQDSTLDLDSDGMISPCTDGMQLIREIEQLQFGGGVDPLS